MVFDNEEYWERRKRGLRGQGKKMVRGKIEPYAGDNRSKDRERSAERRFTKKGYRLGRKLKLIRKG